ncbi:hypothetical protein [Streptomyces sp. NPDC001450]
MEPTVDPFDTSPEAVRRASLGALRGWAARRDSLAEDRRDLMAAAWWAGNRNIAELARTADVSRDTVYDDLSARGIETSDKTSEPPGALPPYAPIPAEALYELARQVWTLVRPSMLTERPDWLPTAAWHASVALARIAVLLDDAAEERYAESAEDLGEQLRIALDAAHRTWGSLMSPDDLASWATADVSHDRALAGDAVLTLALPIGETIRVHLTQTREGQPRAGWTEIRTDSTLLDDDLTGADHLSVRTALDTIARVLTRHLRPEAFEFDRPVSEPIPNVGHHVGGTA